MKTLAGLGLVLVLGCATTTQPYVVSDYQKHAFNQTIHEVESSPTFWDGTQRDAQLLLASAKSDFECSQHLPRNPEMARELSAKAQADAERALRMLRRSSAAPAAAPALADQPSMIATNTITP